VVRLTGPTAAPAGVWPAPDELVRCPVAGRVADGPGEYGPGEYWRAGPDSCRPGAAPPFSGTTITVAAPTAASAATPTPAASRSRPERCRTGGGPVGGPAGGAAGPDGGWAGWMGGDGWLKARLNRSTLRLGIVLTPTGPDGPASAPDQGPASGHAETPASRASRSRSPAARWATAPALAGRSAGSFAVSSVTSAATSAGTEAGSGGSGRSR